MTTDLKLREQCDENLLYVDYQGLRTSVKPGSLIYIADGLLSLRVVEIKDDHVMTKVLNDATISSRKNCNLPGAIIDLPAVSETEHAFAHWKRALQEQKRSNVDNTEVCAEIGIGFF